MTGEDPLVRELEPSETGLAFEAMRALRDSLTDEQAFVSQVNEVQRPQGYRLVAAIPGPAERPVAVAGFRSMHSLGWGSFVYVDDLSTLREARRHGNAGRLLAWVADEALRLGCDAVHLDSGVGASRTDAHRLYLNSGFAITAHHFARSLGAALPPARAQ